MKHRTAKRIVIWALVATAACSGDSTGPSAPTCSSALASQLTLAIGAYASIDPASDGGCVTFPANASTVDSAEYLLVAQSTAGTFGESSPFALRTATLGAAPMLLAQLQQPPVASPTPAGRFGALSDLDANGVVIALMTPVVNSLTTKAACTASGGAYIAGFFFPADLDPSAPAFQTNGGEIFYSIVADPNGTLSCAHSATAIKTGTLGTFAHEFQHMINYAQHTLIQIQGGTVSEEGWLDEGLSQYAEELTARRYLQAGDMATWDQLVGNDVVDAYQYLTATGASPLLIEFDQGTQAERGASWLFTRYLVDQFGAGLQGKLVQNTLAGSANIADQTGHSFDTTVTRWALANWVSV